MSLNWFREFTVSTERGRIAGIIAFIVLPFVFVLSLIRQESMYNLYFFIAINIISLIYFKLFFTKNKNIGIKKGNTSSYEKRVILLYSLPWLFFSIINVTLAQNASIYIATRVSSSFHIFLVALQVTGVTFGAIVGSFVVDFFGRKKSLLLALSLYGTSTALGGIFATNEGFSLMYLINGMSWGGLFVIYIFVVWSDLANGDNSAKIFALGSAIYFFSVGVSSIISQTFLPIASSSLLTCLMIFGLILPVTMCPELVPYDFIQRNRLKQHVDSIRKHAKNQG